MDSAIFPQNRGVFMRRIPNVVFRDLQTKMNNIQLTKSLSEEMRYWLDWGYDEEPLFSGRNWVPAHPPMLHGIYSVLKGQGRYDLPNGAHYVATDRRFVAYANNSDWLKVPYADIRALRLRSDSGKALTGYTIQDVHFEFILESQGVFGYTLRTSAPHQYVQVANTAATVWAVLDFLVNEGNPQSSVKPSEEIAGDLTKGQRELEVFQQYLEMVFRV